VTDSAHFKSGELQVTNSEAAVATWRWPRPGTRCAKTADTLKKEGVEMFIKHSLASGFAGIGNPRENTTMLAGDAKKVTEKIVKAMCGYAGALLTLHNRTTIVRLWQQTVEWRAQFRYCVSWLAREKTEPTPRESLRVSVLILLSSDAFSSISNRMEWSRFVKGRTAAFDCSGPRRR
jgi:hypothetical protein